MAVLREPLVSSNLRFVTANPVDGWTALGDPSRRQIFELLTEQPMSVADLARDLPISRPAVSQHLKVLREARLVGMEPHGTRRIYQARPEGLQQLRADLDRFWTTTLSNVKQLAEEQ